MKQWVSMSSITLMGNIFSIKYKVVDLHICPSNSDLYLSNIFFNKEKI